MSGHQIQKAYAYAHNFSVSFFSTSDIHQSQYLNECQVIGINSSFIEAFCTFCFLYPRYHSKKLMFIIIIISMITIIIIIVIIPHIHPLPCNKPTRDRLQRRRVISHCIRLQLPQVGNRGGSFDGTPWEDKKSP